MRLVVMLTQNDKTVPNAREVFAQCRDTRTQDWGFKNVGVPKETLIELARDIHAAGKTAYMEVVTYSEEECLEAAQTAIDCGVDYLLGTVYYPSVLEKIRGTGLKFFPFCGKVWASPSILGKTPDDVIGDAKKFRELGIDGTDLLLYRFEGDTTELMDRYFAEVDLPTLVAGSINSYERISLMQKKGAWGYTIGSAFFTGSFVPGGSFRENLLAVERYMGSIGE